MTNYLLYNLPNLKKLKERDDLTRVVASLTTESNNQLSRSQERNNNQRRNLSKIGRVILPCVFIMAGLQLRRTNACYHAAVRVRHLVVATIITHR